MKLYADLTGRRTLQILSDVGVLAWVALWAWVGRAVHDATTRLAAPGYTLQGAGSGFRDQMARAGQSVSDVPLVGDSLAEPFQRAGNAGTSIEQAGKDLVSAVDSLAILLGWVTALVPIVLVVVVWLFSGCGSSDAPPPPSASSTRTPTSTCSRCGPWPGSPCTGWPGCATTRPGHGGAATRTTSAHWPYSSCATAACDPRRPGPVV